MHASHAEQLACNPVRERYQEVRNTTLQLTQPYSAEDLMLQSMPDASPAKWHLAHTTWFFETFILSAYVPDYKPYDPRYKHLFNSYYKQLGSHPYRGARGLMSRPSLREVHEFRTHVDEAMLRHLEVSDERTTPLVEIGLNHEQQHQELILTDIKHALWFMPLRPGKMRSSAGATPTVPRLVEKEHGSMTPLEWIDSEGGIHKIGHSGADFSFDNECPRHEVLLQPFRIGSRLVTNAEYLQFMSDGGYHRPELWLSDGWDVICAQGWKSPLYWEESEGDWFEFTFDGIREIDLAAPVCHVSYYEADAFAHWSKARLPREEEWEVVAAQASTSSSSQLTGTLLESGKLHPQPAGGKGLQQMFGDVWEWTSSPYVGYPGFEPAAGAIGEYNGKFMCNQFVLRGGSCATPASHIRASYRNFFPPHARWQFMGIRLAK
jgi:ergothioneine biosynthesis protein EgtB